MAAKQNVDEFDEIINSNVAIKFLRGIGTAIRDWGTPPR